MRVRIYSPTKGWLDGYDGGNSYTWHNDKAQAWLMPVEEAERRLVRIKEDTPDACIPVPQ